MKSRIFGLVVTAVGILALLQVTGIHPFGLTLWPTVLFLVGASILTGSLFNRWKPSLFGAALGTWIGAIGLFDLLKNNGIVDVDGMTIAKSGWPLLIIAVGLTMVFGRNKFHQRWHRHHKYWKGAGSMGDMHFGGGPWRLESDLNVNHGMGDLKVDLTTAEITEGEHKVNLSVGMGELMLRVPSTVHIRVKANAGLGEVFVFGERRGGIGAVFEAEYPFGEAKTVLNIEASVGMGSVRIIQGVQPAARIVA